MATKSRYVNSDGKRKHPRWGIFCRSAVLLAVLLSMLPATAAKHTISAYCLRGKTALGTRPHLGTCAGPRKYLGRFVRIGGRRYRVEDTCRRGFDIWMPTRQKCKKFGRRKMTVVVGGSFLHRHRSHR